MVRSNQEAEKNIFPIPIPIPIPIAIAVATQQQYDSMKNLSKLICITRLHCNFCCNCSILTFLCRIERKEFYKSNDSKIIEKH